MRAAFFDVGDTLVDERRSRAVLAAASRERLVAAFGERAWYDSFLTARHGGDDEDPVPQQTLRWIDVEPAAVVDELTELPATVAGWVS